jgi:hypothetical protein
MKSLPECENCKADPRIVLQENKSKITFFNADRNEIRIIKIDGCVIKDNKTLRCDYGIIPCGEAEIYVELKGKGIEHGIKQIASTIKSLSSNPQKIRKLCFIVCSKVAPRANTGVQKSKSLFKKNFNAELKVNNTPEEYDLGKL